PLDGRSRRGGVEVAQHALPWPGRPRPRRPHLRRRAPRPRPGPETVMTWPAVLVLSNGRVFRGRGFGARVESIGEVVFNTSITGYQEILSDPSYAGQIVVMTATQIGNVGVNREDLEARKLACAGFAIREKSPLSASWRAEDVLDRWLEGAGIPGIDD